ncbi:hypothetical protein [Ruegeria profundi]|uniref:hypothetical protein n=1 Tax=Ruegeria profundi TaxID=1685378 RepID=UPI001CD22D3F|nr:hypothetical protein [Ruegeria profundi]MCA0927142.1 hypothetical protein [Ruegeria profundi]
MPNNSVHIDGVDRIATGNLEDVKVDGELTLVVGQGQYDSIGEQVTVAKEFYLKRHLHHQVIRDKTAGTWTVPGKLSADFDHEQVPKGSKTTLKESENPRHRRNKYVQTIGLLVLDCDDSADDFDAFVQSIEKLGLEALVYTTHSHGAEGKGNRYRVELFLSEPWLVEYGSKRLEDAYKAAAQLLRVKHDEACKDPARLFYEPSVANDRKHLARSQYVPGRLLKLAELLPVEGPHDWFEMITREAPSVLSREVNRGLKWELHCPNAEEHTDGRTEGAFLSREEGFPHIGCRHTHCLEMRPEHFIQRLMFKGVLTYEQVAKYSLRREMVDVTRESRFVNQQVAKIVLAKGTLFAGPKDLIRVKPRSKPGEEFVQVDKDTIVSTLQEHIQFHRWSRHEDPDDREPVVVDPSATQAGRIIGQLKHDLPQLKSARRPYSPGFEEAGFSEQHGFYQIGERHTDGMFTPQGALDFLNNEVLADFPFLTENDRWAAISMLMTAVMRPVLNTVPGYMITGPGTESGKTYLAGVASVISTETAKVGARTFPGSEAELRKELVAASLVNKQVLIFDNVKRGTELNSDIMASMITTGEIEGRILGASKDVKISIPYMTIVTGNNIEMVDDLGSRFIGIRFEQTQSNMSDREFRHRDLHRYIVENYERVNEAIYCLLSLAEATSTASRFQGWNDTVFSALAAVGAPNFVEADKATRAENATLEHSKLRWLQSVYELTERGVQYQSNELFDLLKDEAEIGPDGMAGRDHFFRVVEERFSDKQARKFRSFDDFTLPTFGRWLSKFEGEKIGEYKLVKVSRGVGQSGLYYVEKA